jgi:PadR family transcriptional regulator, regulatory protein AphA
MYQYDMSMLSATGRVILGLLKWEPRTGYDVKRVTDYSTRFFWRASYGQIYPELRSLERAGFVVARDEPHGRRRRRVHELTPAGEQALFEWLAGTDDSYDLRDEGLLRLFFGELMSHEQLLELVRRRRRWFSDAGQHFLEIAEELGPIEGPSAEVLRYGLDLMAWSAAWWAELETRLLATGPSSPQSDS